MRRSRGLVTWSWPVRRPRCSCMIPQGEAALFSRLPACLVRLTESNELFSQLLCFCLLLPAYRPAGTSISTGCSSQASAHTALHTRALRAPNYQHPHMPCLTLMARWDGLTLCPAGAPNGRWQQSWSAPLLFTPAGPQTSPSCLCADSRHCGAAASCTGGGDLTGQGLAAQPGVYCSWHDRLSLIF